MPVLLRRLRGLTVLRYLIASVISLGVDMGVFAVLLALGAAAAPAAAAGYALGIASHWMISTRKVFAGRVASPGPARTRQKAMFVATALVGLGITTVIVGAATIAGIEPYLAKLTAIAASFMVTWTLRAEIIFR